MTNPKKKPKTPAPPTMASTADDLSDAHRRLARRYHPDWNLASTLEERDLLTRSTKSLHVAYGVLRDPLYDEAINGHVMSSSDLAQILDWSRPPSIGECMFCSSVPACDVWAGHQHSLPRQRFPVQGVMCRDCGRCVVRQKQRRTLWSGWWTSRGFVTNLLLIVQNTQQLWQLRRLEAPRPPDERVVGLLKSPLTVPASVWPRALMVAVSVALCIWFITTLIW